MDAHSLKTATAYINNLLLARGLLRDGKAIEFAHPSRGEGGKEQTMAHIINLVHDLILKRDRDQEYRGSIAETLRSLRSESTRQTVALEKLQTRNEDLARQLSLAQSQERSARAALRTAESSARSLRDEMLRLKTTVQQVRTSCANDVRKRDVQIQRLKSHLTTQQRGNKTGLVGASITINPGSIGLGGSTSSIRDDAPDLDDPGYSLKQETTEFLTQLSQSLSDENDNLIGLVRSTLMTLKELQGMPDQNSQRDAGDLSVIGEEDENTRSGMFQALPTNYETLATDMDTVLDNLKNLLTNPNFVAVDEVELREEEILRLRAGWEKMEGRLREAFMMMDSWRKRMTNGDTINLDELKMGLGLGVGLETVNREEISMMEDDDDEDDEDEEAEAEMDAEDVSSVFDEDLEEPQEPPTPQPLDHTVEATSNSEMFKLKLKPTPGVLRETNGNKSPIRPNKSPIRSPRKVAFSASIPNTPTQLEEENSGIDLVGEERSRSGSREEGTPRHTRKRHSSPRPHPDEPSPKLTVHDKLAQAEAAAAAVAEGLKVTSAVRLDDGTETPEGQRKRRATRSPTKTKIQGRPKRRKSTLTPEELENLLGC
ncbi:Afadin and alpha-actinin-binding-domain-containing protein [Phaeosphaeria sp. MPI-PUGE-AT-0046c]|nr:Afadin and alpha-actinin-binding-domain-containing protein [Phaeosphaeria sp. MPI-PUGE-AT-0046c]